MKKVYRVSEINRYVRDVLTNIPFLNNISIRGEIINLKKYSRAFYFTLKEADEARISAVTFNVHSFPATLKDGDEVVVTGRISLHEKGGTYQIIANEVVYYGLGAKLLALKALYDKFSAQGLFDEKLKKPLPKFPTRIGVIAPRDSAALSDIVTNIERRFPLVTLVIKEAIVQGDLAPKSIKTAYEYVTQQNIDVLIVARGGGSSDDLWAFNDEEVVLTFAARKVPLISAIGHEIDTTLVDYLSDARASTPTAAAELVVPHQDDLTQTIYDFNARIRNSIHVKLAEYSTKLDLLVSRPVLKNYGATLEVISDQVALLGTKLQNSVAITLKDMETAFNLALTKLAALGDRMYNTRREKVNTLLVKLETLNPKLVLNRGYAFISREDVIIKSSKTLAKGDKVKIQFSDGAVKAQVEDKDE
ncbi:MAG TPA: exodeoxyribonuclease VII large subunit [Bacilli bacterium]|nr:exodeoxyribonuclease VII large subunit [Bacilli bacterium]